MDWVIIVLTALDLAVILLGVSAIFTQAGIIKRAVIAVSVFSMLYCTASGLLFWADMFRFASALGIVLAVGLAFAACLWRKRPKAEGRKALLRSVPIIEVALIVAALLLSGRNFELYESGQDQGLYQVEAVELYMGNYEVEHDYTEYQILETDEQRAAYQKFVNSDIGGYYTLSAHSRIQFDETERLSDVSGMYHGIQTFPAMLALGGRLFGLENMSQVQTIFFACSILLLYYALCNIGLTGKGRMAALSVLGLSPLVIWISKTTFTEMPLTLCVAFYVFLLTEADAPWKRLLMALPLIAFAYIHVSFLLIYPIFMLIHLLLYARDRQREYIAVDLLASVGLVTGCFMMGRVAPGYFFDNMARLYFGSVITANDLLWWIFAGAAAVCLVSLLVTRYRHLDLAYEKIQKLSAAVPVLAVVLFGIMAVHIVTIGCFRTPEDGWHQTLCWYYGQGLIESTAHSAIFAMALSVGVVSFLLIIWHLVRWHKDMRVSPTVMAIDLLILYCVLFQFAFFRKEVNYYYYYSRYLVIYVPILCLAFGFALKKAAKPVAVGVTVLSILCMACFDLPLLLENDQTWLEWETLEDINAAVEDDSAIILDKSIVRTAGPLVKARTGESIFPVFEDFDAELALLGENYEHIYYLTQGPADGVSDGAAHATIVYQDRYTYQSTGVTKRGSYPIYYPATQVEIVLYAFGPEEQSINLDRLGVMNGEKTEECIISNGDPGLVIYGPYVTLPQGEYYFDVPIEIVSQQQASLGTCYIGNVAEGEDSILGKTALEIYLETDQEGGAHLRVPFSLEKETESIEFKIDATEGAVFKVYPYKLIHMTE